VDFGITFLLLVAFMAAWGTLPAAGLLWLPLFLLLLLVTALGVGFWLSALNVEYRDVMYTLPFLSQAWFFATPVVYPASLVPERFRPLLGLNPMAGVVEGFRWSLLGAGQGPSPMLAVSAAVALLLFLTGIVWFRKRERTFVDALGSGGR
jgi:lipopolysaccharide transport system permease protein